ncbi:MAG: hypothetical protein D3926_06945 [Desulfobacteraceae bacterium]|nr:MAG: hypothetical protein D3926_06945 [Desulfobacteraceae bacterium]
MGFFNKNLVLSVLLAVLWFSSQMVWAQEFLYFSDPGFGKFGKSEYPNTLFSHDLHATAYQIECKSCHHIYASGKNIWEEDMHTQMCSDCHGDSKAELVNAYHMNCWGCHKKIQQEYYQADTPTSDCSACHVAENDQEAEQARIIEKTKKTDKTLLKVIKMMKTKAFY